MVRRTPSAIALLALLVLASLSSSWRMRASTPESLSRTTPTLAPTPTSNKGSPRESASVNGLIPRPDPAMMESVQAAVPELFRIASADPEAFGMGPEASLESTRLLSPYPTYHLTKAEGESLDRDSDLISRLKLTGAWHVPVDWGDGPGAIVYVNHSGGVWTVTGIGGRNKLIALRSALASVGSSTDQVYFVDELPNRTDIIIAQTPRGFVAVALTRDNIERSLHGLPLSAARAVDVVNSTLP